jgi:hypothetical protein
MLQCSKTFRRIGSDLYDFGWTLADKSIGVAEVEVQQRKLTKSRKARREIGSHNGRRRSGDCYLIGGDRFLARMRLDGETSVHGKAMASVQYSIDKVICGRLILEDTKSFKTQTEYHWRDISSTSSAE